MSGINKQKYKNIKKWLIDNELKIIDVAKKAGVSPQAVWLFMRGNTSKNIKNTFICLGCTEEIIEQKATKS